MKVLITGGNGFIGSHLTEALLNRKIQVSILDTVSNKNTRSLNCKKIKGDIREYSLCLKAIRNVDVVVHLAAVSRVEWCQRDPFECLGVNVIGTLNVLEAIRKSNPKAILVLGSSREVYGEPSFIPVSEDDPKNPISIYGVSKLASEKLVLSYRHVYGLRYVILRFSNVYGSPRDLPERVIPKFMQLALLGKPLRVFGGEQKLDFTFIDDIIEGIILVIEKAVNENKSVINQDFLFASGEESSIFQLAELIKNICESASEVIVSNRRSFDVSSFVGNYQKAKISFGYTPKHLLHNGLKIYKQRIDRVA